MNNKISTKPAGARPHSNISNQVVNQGSGTVNLENYLENTLNPSDDLEVLTQDSSIQEDDYHIHSKTHSNSNGLTLTTETTEDPDNLHLKIDTPVKTNDNKFSHLSNEIFLETPSKVTTSIITPLPAATGKGRYNDAMTAVEVTETGATGKDPTSIFEKDNTVALGYKLTGYYSSPYLNDEFKPSIASLDIPQELEPLKPLILSQHEVFSQPIKDLGNINLVLSQIIEKKKESFSHLKNGTRIPRSLRIKCELTTSPSYANNQDFLELRESLQNAVVNFVQEGTKVMSAWANKNIQLLIHDRCADILKSALHILDGLTSFYTEIIGTPSWPSLPSQKYTSLFLFKLYFSNDYIETNDLVKYLELPVDTILLLGTKILTKITNDEEAYNLLSAVNFSDIDDENPIDENIISETLIGFDQIIRATTIGLWAFQQDRDKKHAAAQNLKAKMKAAATTNATAATAQALMKANENINTAYASQHSSNLRISNLEKSVKKNEHKTNTLVKELISKKLMQKNLHGSYRAGSVAAPEMTTLANQSNIRNKAAQRIIDLSTDETDDTPASLMTLNSPPHHHKRATKKQRRDKNLQPQHGKTIHWKDSEYKSFNPHLPATAAFNPSPHLNNAFSLNNSPAVFPYMQNQPEASLIINGYNWGMPLPHTNPNPFQQRQNVLGSQTTTPYATGNPFTTNYQHLHLNQSMGNPFTTSFQQAQMNGNTYNPTHFFPTKSNGTTKENPFGTGQNTRQQ